MEEPAPHSVEELLKATIDGDTSEVMMESWENVRIEEIMAAQEEFHGKENERRRLKNLKLLNLSLRLLLSLEIVEPETAEPEIVEPETVEQSTHSEPKEVEESKLRNQEPLKKRNRLLLNLRAAKPQ